MSAPDTVNEIDSAESNSESEGSDGEPEPEVPPSELGTKAYWDSYYESEIKNFENCGVRDDGWFGQGCRKRVIQYLNKSSDPKTSPVLDLGCGNGEMIQLLVENGWTNITGYDYSEPAISLCKMIFKDEEGIDFEENFLFLYASIIKMNNRILCTVKAWNFQSSMNSIQKILYLLRISYFRIQKYLPDRKNSTYIYVVDLTEHLSSNRKYHICLDKGTFDAISINPDKSRAQCTKAYFQNAQNLLEDEGLLIITSCNWTEDELIEMAKDCFNLKDRIPCPTFSFGGKSGKSVSTVVFQKSPFKS